MPSKINIWEPAPYIVKDIELADWGRKDDVMMSYAYFGWVFDRLTDDPATCIPASQANLGGFGTIPTEAASLLVPKQFVGFFNGLVNLALVAQTHLDVTPLDLACVRLATSDIPMPGGYEADGNGGGSTVYHLREGVERFMITDINNPAGSAHAQSVIYMIFDAFSSDVATFNHAPGGCNILYMDGHVAFQKYPADQPVNKGMALLIGALVNE